MNFEEELKILVASYADFDQSLFIYKDKKELTVGEKQKLEASFMALVCQYVSQEGLSEEKMTPYVQELATLFHPDRYPLSSAENKWLEGVLSPELGEHDTCFNLIKLCETKLKHPELPQFHFENISTIEALMARLKRDKRYATTYTERALLESVLAMLRSADHYNNQLNSRISLIWAQRITQLMPYLTTGYCVTLFLKELALLYAVTYTLTRGGRWIEQSSPNRLQMIGQAMRMFGETIFGAVTALIARLTELNIFMARGALNLSIDAGDGLYRLLIASPVQPSEMLSNDAKALALAPQDLFGGLRFRTFELKLISMSLEEKSKRLKGQWFLDWRLGGKKNTAIRDTLRALQRLDKSDIDVSLKLQEASKIIKHLADNKLVNVKGSDSYKAITSSEATLKILDKSNLASQEEKYIAPCNT